MNTLWKTLSWIIVITFFLLTVLLSFWSFYPYKLIVFNNLPLKVLNKTVKAGEVLVYSTDYCKFTNIIPEVKKTFVNDIIYSIPTGTVLAKEKGCRIINVQIDVPKNLPPSRYILKITYEYQVNPIRKVNIYVQTELFEVIK